MWWIRLAVQGLGRNSRLHILAVGARTDYSKPSQPY